jgi:hypothetical protein
MDICIVTSAGNDEQGRELLRLMGMPFRKRSGETTTKGPCPKQPTSPSPTTTPKPIHTSWPRSQ